MSDKTKIRCVEDSDRVYVHFPFDRGALRYLNARVPEEGRDKSMGLGWQKDLGCFAFLCEHWEIAEKAISDGLGGDCEWEWCDNLQQFSPTAHRILSGV